MPEMLRLEQAAVRAYSYGRFRELLEAANNARSISSLLLNVVFQGRESILFKKVEKAIHCASEGQINLGIAQPLTLQNYKEAVTVILNKIVSKGGYYILKSVIADALLKVLEMHYNIDLGWHDAKGFKMIEPRSSQQKLKVVGVQWPPKPGRSKQNDLDSDPELLFEDREPSPSGGSRWTYIQVAGPRIEFCGRPISRYYPLTEETLQRYLHPYRRVA